MNVPPVGGVKAFGVRSAAVLDDSEAIEPVPPEPGLKETVSVAAITTVLDAADGALYHSPASQPAPLMATTSKDQESPGVRPFTTQEVALELIEDGQALLKEFAGVVESMAWTSYPEIADPPSEEGAVQVTLADAEDILATTSVGRPGFVGVTRYQAGIKAGPGTGLAPWPTV
jgi:hypothetical protein